jgi:RNase H-fold protein (predicted Holliday junction resolvase)
MNEILNKNIMDLYFNIQKIKDRILVEKYNKKILGVDFGTRKIGLASFSLELNIFSVLKKYERSSNNLKKDIDFFVDLIERENFYLIIVGSSLITDFRQGKKIIKFGNEYLFKKTLEFFNKIKERIEQKNSPGQKLDFVFFDESFTSAFSNQVLYNMNLSKALIEKNKDSLAALKILSDALDELDIAWIQNFY